MSILNELGNVLDEDNSVATVNINVTTCKEMEIDRTSGTITGCPYYERDREFGPMCKLHHIKHDEIYDSMIGSKGFFKLGGCPLGLEIEEN